MKTTTGMSVSKLRTDYTVYVYISMSEMQFYVYESFILSSKDILHIPEKKILKA